MNAAEWEMRREYLLTEYDAWRNGERATPGQPANGLNYSTTMRIKCTEIETELRGMGAWGNAKDSKQ